MIIILFKGLVFQLFMWGSFPSSPVGVIGGEGIAFGLFFINLFGIITFPSNSIIPQPYPCTYNGVDKKVVVSPFVVKYTACIIFFLNLTQESTNQIFWANLTTLL